MKKTKIIIPALAAICLTTAATVSSTVAWFASSRTTKITAENIAIVNPEGSLNCGLTALSNTAVDGSKVSLKKNASNVTYRMRDASVACTASSITPLVYRAKGVDSETHKGTAFDTVSSNYVYSETDAICYCASWKMTFSMSGNSSDQYDITFNNTSSKVQDYSGSDEIFVAYRVAFLTASAFWIWAPNQSGTINYINGTTSSSIGTYSTEVIKADTVIGTIGTADNTASNPKSLDVYAYMWFEGTDPNCVESKLSAGVQLNASALFQFDAPLHS